MRGRGRRTAWIGVLALAATVATAGPASGLDTSGVGGVSVPQVQTPTQLPQTPGASVSVPQVPHVQTPSVPQVQAPSTPSVSTPSVPSVRTLATSGQSSQSTSGGGGGGSTGSAPRSASRASGSSSAGGGASRRSARVTAGRTTPQARALRHEARERQVRSEVRRLSSCLGSLDQTERRFLSLRAGLNGPPMSRAAAARRLRIPLAWARGVEQRSLRALRNACGVSAGGAGATAEAVANRVASMPQLQDVSLLVATGGADPAELVDQSELAGNGSQQVKAETKSSEPEPSHNEGSPEPATIEATSKPLAAAQHGVGGAFLDVVLCLALLTAIALVALRRPRRSRPAGGPPAENLTAWMAVTAAPVAPAREPEPEQEPEPGSEPAPKPQQPPPAAFAPTPPQPPTRAGRDYGRAARPAAMVASGALSFVARELMRRRGGRRR